MHRTTKLGLGLFVISFLSVGILSGTIEDLVATEHGATETVTSLTPGDPWRVAITGPFSSYRGIHEIAAPKAEFLPAAGDPVELQVEAIDVRPLLAATMTESTDFDAKLLEEPVEPILLVQIPESLAGSRGEVQLSGTIVLSEIVVDRAQSSYTSQGNPVTFEEAVAVTVASAGTDTSPASVLPEPESPRLRLYRAFLGVASVLLMLSIVLMFGASIGVRLLVTSFMLIGIPSLILAFLPGKNPFTEKAEDPESEAVQRVSPGSSFTVRPRVKISTVDQFHRVSYLSAWIKGIGAEQLEVMAEPTGNKIWRDEIQVGYARVGPVFKTNRFRIHPSLSVELPSAEQLSGDTATLVVYGVISYPDLGSLEILNPLDIEYEVSAQPFSETMELDFGTGSKASVKEENSALESTLLASMTIGVFLLLFGVLRGIKRAIFG